MITIPTENRSRAEQSRAAGVLKMRSTESVSVYMRIHAQPHPHPESNGVCVKNIISVQICVDGVVLNSVCIAYIQSFITSSFDSNEL